MKNNKILIVVISILILFAHITIVFAFSPVPSDIAGHWAENVILQWQTEGKIKGYEDNRFRPDASITRAEFIYFIALLL